MNTYPSCERVISACSMPEHGEPQINYCGEPGGRATPYGDSPIICTYHRMLSNHVLLCRNKMGRVEITEQGLGAKFRKCGDGGYCNRAPTRATVAS